VRSYGTKYLFLSISGKFFCPYIFSQIIGILSGYLTKTLLDSFSRLSNE